MKTISLPQLQILLARVKGAKPLTISAFVDARAKKTGNPFAEIRKLSKVNGFTGANYEASVNRQQDREGTVPAFEAKERSWGERVSSALVEKDGKWYLAIQPRATSKPMFFARMAGQPFKLTVKEAIAHLLPAHKSNAESQGVDKEVVYRNYALANIAAITMDGESYRIRH
jgi:predicted 2-oxoglutarate/Fe(II)-dependent dioxygenase YbiX